MWLRGGKGGRGVETNFLGSSLLILDNFLKGGCGDKLSRQQPPYIRQFFGGGCGDKLSRQQPPYIRQFFGGGRSGV
jgi:hypothetical protein